MANIGFTKKEKEFFFKEKNVYSSFGRDSKDYIMLHIYDLDGEWYNNLGADDLIDFFKFVELNTHEIIAGPYSVWKQNIWSEWEEINNCYMNLAVEEVA